jgi:hypothetical protein
LPKEKDAKTMDIETLLTVRKFSDLLQDARAAIQEYFIVGDAALAAQQHLIKMAERFEGLQTPAMPPKPEGTRFRTLPPPTAAELQHAGLSEELLLRFVTSIESTRETEPRTQGAKLILRQMQNRGATEQQFSKVRSALGMLEALAVSTARGEALSEP